MQITNANNPLNNAYMPNAQMIDVKRIMMFFIIYVVLDTLGLPLDLLGKKQIGDYSPICISAALSLDSIYSCKCSRSVYNASNAP